VLLILGLAAIARSVSSTVVSTAFFGWLLVLGSVFELVDAFMVGKWADFFLHLLVAILFAVAGVFMLLKPVISAETITYVMAMFFLIGGLYTVVSSLVTHLPGWGWEALSGSIASLLGFFLLAQWPISGLYAIGVFVGVYLISYGCTWIALAVDLHKT
jgi:uncharacterized membrane protein HdeD (DUF308 family)